MTSSVMGLSFYQSPALQGAGLMMRVKLLRYQCWCWVCDDGPILAMDRELEAATEHVQQISTPQNADSSTSLAPN